MLLCCGFLTMPLVYLCAQSGAQPVSLQAGRGSYLTRLPVGAREPPAAISRTENYRGPVPTNRWWSSMAWMDFSERQFPHPLAVQAEASGLRIFYPGPHLHAANKAIMAIMPGGGDDLILGHSNQPRFPDARLDGASDWFVRAGFHSGSNRMVVSYGHGSPYIFALFQGGTARLRFGRPPTVWSENRPASVLGITVNGKHYGLFGPSGSTWVRPDERTLVNQAGNKPYFSLALLPSRSQEVLDLFARHAQAHVIDTRVEWAYDPAGSTVSTTFRFVTKPYEGQESGTLFALYPHQWKNTDARLFHHEYSSIRGVMKLGQGSMFRTRLVFPGVLPGLPGIGSGEKARLDAYLDEEARIKPGGIRDTYWEGKWLGKLATLVPIAQQNGNQAAADLFLRRLRQRLETWFSATDEQGHPKRTGAFYLNRTWGTLIGYPASYGSDTELNDHHFHHGYFVRAAAEVARNDPAWAGKDQWGPMVELLIRDVASPDRNDPQFPFLRNFDPFAGHSWASGHARFGDGNNQESSSEAMNAWYGLILWGEATGNRPLRDLGVYLFTTELAAINAYWFDVLGENFPKTFPQPTVGLVWGGKADYATWFSARPECIHAINWLPLHGGSLYLGLYPEYVRKNYEGLKANRGGTNWQDWPDIIWMYLALADPAAALAQFQARQEAFKPEGGNSKANTYHWLHCLNRLGQVERSITADYPLFAVFRRGDTLHYVVYNMGKETRMVNFSDGFQVKALPGGFTQKSARKDAKAQRGPAG